MKQVESVAVIGGGLMGSGIAESAARAELEVTLCEASPEAVDKARGRIEGSLAAGQKSGKLAAEQVAEILERIALTTDQDALAHADLFVEAVPESVELKLDVLRGVGERARPDAIISSNTSSIPIAVLSEAIPNPERVVGLHFFSPVPVMKLVEVVRALDSSDETVARARAFTEQIGKVPIETKDRSGFVVNMLLVPYLTAAIRMYEEGFASREASTPA